MLSEKSQIHRKTESALWLLLNHSGKLELSDSVKLFEAAIRKLHISPALQLI
jgi:hypothetical protein